MAGDTQHHIQIGDTLHTVGVTAGDGDALLVTVGDRVLRVTLDGDAGPSGLAITIDGVRHSLYAQAVEEGIELLIGGDLITTARLVRGGAGAGSHDGAAGPLSVRAPMPGVVKDCFVADDAAVEKGAPLLVLEAMKMNNQIRAGRAGTVQGVAVTAGQRVNKGDVLLTIV